MNAFIEVFLWVLGIVLVLAAAIFASEDLQNEKSSSSKLTKFFEGLYLIVAGSALLTGILLGLNSFVKLLSS